MFEVAETAETGALAAGLNEMLDELSTRLMIEGVAALTAEEFRQLAGKAGERASFAGIADRLAAMLESGADAPDAATRLSEGLEELRQALLEPVTAAGPSGTQAEPAIAPEKPASDAGLLAADEEMIREFITESGEHLSNIEGHMLLLEKDNRDVETLNAVFRAFHTIKGLAGFLDFPSIQSLAHEVETLLDLARTFLLEVTPTVVDVVLQSTDVVRQELAGIDARLAGMKAPPTGVTPELLRSIREIAGGQAATGEASPANAPAEVQAEAAATKAVTKAAAEAPAAAAPAATQKAAAAAVEAEAAEPVKAATSASAKTAAPAKAAAAPEAPAQRAAGEHAKAADSTSLRIDTAKLDQLMDMVGEMVIAQTLIGHSPALASVKDARLLRDLTQLARITTDVQRITTGMRMVPIGLQFQKTARLVRDLSRKAGKQIVLETTGEDTELDKSIAEELSDPLLHMVRNSIDHGIETPPERQASGKDATARIRLSAYHQSGQIVVEISDDGRGLNREKILAKALQNGLIQPGAQLSDQEIFLLIFEAGFSTADKVTDISGRGVGMDVVRKHVQKLRGRIEIQSTAGKGTTFFIKLPLTLAIIEGLVVVVGDERYIVPIFSVKEMFRPTAEMLSTVQGTGEMTLVRGGLLPIVRLHRRFETKPKTSALTEGVLIVAESGGKQFCLFVDELVGKQEVVIKSLGETFKHVQGIAGCAILGDGRVGLILDIDGIYKGRA